MLKRIPVKYVRDYIKKYYKLEKSCYICGDTDNLELHHLYSVSELWASWLEDKKITGLTLEDVLTLREEFYSDNIDLLSEKNLYTLCKTHHERLHNIYGQRYSNWRAEKVLNWIKLQKQKVEND